ncbi:MAG: hypothetical protein HFJ17_04045 [Clostridia bacterium]|nr:hypothetical protein [Clostridia bacterium]
MKELIDKIKENSHIIIKEESYIVKTKTWYSIEEDNEASYVKCELSNNKVLVIIPEDDLMYIGEVIENMKYKKIDDDKIEYDNVIYSKTGDGHQFITDIEFGSIKEVEGKCIFEDYESENNIISLGVLTDKNVRADVYADILNIEDIEIN